MIDYGKLLEELESQDVGRMMAALSEISSERKEVPPREIVDAGGRLLHHRDPEIRFDALMALGIHWGAPDFLESILTWVDHEEDPEILEAGIRALGRYSHEDEQKVCAALVKIVDASPEPAIVALAYYTLRRAEGLSVVGMTGMGLGAEEEPPELDDALLAKWRR